MTIGIDARIGTARGERIVGRDGAVVIDAMNLAPGSGQILNTLKVTHPFHTHADKHVARIVEGNAAAGGGVETVYDLARWRNAQADADHIPEHSITRAPSAELKPDQTDQDSLPPYDALDDIPSGLIEGVEAI